MVFWGADLALRFSPIGGSEMRGTGVEAQGTMGRRQGADTKREGEAEIRALLALLGAQIQRLSRRLRRRRV